MAAIRRRQLDEDNFCSANKFLRAYHRKKAKVILGGGWGVAGLAFCRREIMPPERQHECEEQNIIQSETMDDFR